MTVSGGHGQELAERLDPVCLTLLVEDRQGKAYHLPPELGQLASDHALWAYAAGYASHVGRQFLRGLRRGLKLPDADKIGEDVGEVISGKVVSLRDALAQRRSRSKTAVEQEARELGELISGINSEPVDEAARQLAQGELRATLKQGGATLRQADKIVDEIDRTIFSRPPH